MILTLTLLHFLAMVIKINWSWSVAWYDMADLLHKHRAAATMRFIAAETKPFYLPAVAVYWGTYPLTSEDLPPLWVMALCVAIDLTLWVFFRNRNPDDDDRWERRRKRASESIKRVGARLVVVPAPATN
jgi:Ser/Thr protein kinase RdoA (MazF antagonist)